MIRLRLVPAVVVLAAVRAAAAGQPVPVFFDTWLGFDTGVFAGASAWFPTSQVAADLDNDGDLDVVVGNFGPFTAPKITVLLNHGDGTFAQPVPYPVLKTCQGVAAGDFDGDGFADVLAANTGVNWEGTTVSLLRSKGDGTFHPGVAIGVGAGPTELAVGDFDGDGSLDFASADYGYLGQGSTVTIRFNDGAGAFPQQVKLASPKGPNKLVAADLNGDGLVDLAVTCEVTMGSQQVAVFLNSAGGFGAPATYGTGAWPVVVALPIAAGDVDNDGDIDLVVSVSSGGSSGVALLRNNGSGAFAAPQVFPFPPFSSPASGLALADLTGDGWLDGAAVHQAGDSWTVMPNDGAGSFGAGTRMLSGQYPIAVSTGDADGDGSADVLISNRSSLELTVHRNDGAGEFPRPPIIDLAFGMRTLDSGDIDGDEIPDLAVGGDGAFRVLLGNGDGTFAPPIMHNAGKSAQELKLRDLNGDGLPDLLWIPPATAPPYHFFTAMNLGGGTFGPTQTCPINTCGNSDVDAFDLDGDGDLDVVVTEWLGCPSVPLSARRVFLARNLGAGTFELLPPLIVDPFPAGVASDDFNGDGIADLAVGSIPVGVLLGGGNMSYSGPIKTDAVSLSLIAADLNQDGVPDLALEVPDHTGTIESFGVLIGKGDGSFQPVSYYLASYSPDLRGISGVGVSDVDGDGVPDGFTANYASHDVSVFLNGGDGAFSPQTRYGIGGNPLDMVIADLNGDGAPDVAAVVGTGPPLSAGVAVLLGQPASCYPDCDGNGALNIDDFICFQLRFALQDPYADCDGNGVFNIDDFVCFQLAFALAGC